MGPLYIGRAMGQYSRIVYAYTYFDDIVAREGWDDWGHQITKDRTGSERGPTIEATTREYKEHYGSIG